MSARLTRWLGGLALIVLVACLGAPSARADPAALWAALRNGEAVALMRHALAPGTGDPSEFKLGDCATQRNLSEDGRRQAVAIGERLRAAGIQAAGVYSSEWCRCQDTARLLGLGEVKVMPFLNSFFADRASEAQQTAAAQAFIAAATGGLPTILVTHQVNITALTGVTPASGELVLVPAGKTGALQVLGTIPPDA